MIEALEPSVVYLLPYNKLLTLTEISWEINMFYRKILEYSLIVSQIKLTPGGLRLHASAITSSWNIQPEVIKRAPLSHIASYLLMTPETLSRYVRAYCNPPPVCPENTYLNLYRNFTISPLSVH